MASLIPASERAVIKVTPDEHPTLEQALAAVNAYKAIAQIGLRAKTDALSCAGRAHEAASRTKDPTAGNTATAAAKQATQHASTATSIAKAVGIHARVIMAAANFFEEISSEIEPAKAATRSAYEAARTAQTAALEANASAEIARKHTLATRERLLITMTNRRRIDQGRYNRQTITWLMGIILAICILCLLGLELLARIFPGENIPH